MFVFIQGWQYWQIEPLDIWSVPLRSAFNSKEMRWDDRSKSSSWKIVQLAMFDKRTGEEPHQPRHRNLPQKHMKMGLANKTRGTWRFHGISMCTCQGPISHSPNPSAIILVPRWGPNTLHPPPSASRQCPITNFFLLDPFWNYEHTITYFLTKHKELYQKIRETPEPRSKTRFSGLVFPSSGMESEPSSSTPLPGGVSLQRTLRHPPTRKYLPPQRGDEAWSGVEGSEVEVWGKMEMIWGFVFWFLMMFVSFGWLSFQVNSP